MATAPDLRRFVTGSRWATVTGLSVPARGLWRGRRGRQEGEEEEEDEEEEVDDEEEEDEEGQRAGPGWWHATTT